jgi:hypothetical protein
MAATWHGWLRGVLTGPAVALTGLGCGLVQAQQTAGDEAQLQALRSEILGMIGDAPCANLVHCRLLALGTRPCGGADEYFAYSSHTANRAVLENKALEYTLIQEDVQRAKSVAGVCVVLPEPRLVCVDRRCRAVSEQ